MPLFDPADPSLEGRRVRWTVWGITYEGIIKKVVTEKGLYERGDWMVLPDENAKRGSSDTAQVIGCLEKLIEQSEAWHVDCHCQAETQRVCDCGISWPDPRDC